MTEQRFKCTACGKCCTGWVPLTVDEALAHAALFPVAIIWTPVAQSSKAFALTAQIGTTIKLANRKTFALSIVPTAYIPPSFACPALSPENLCSIQNTKPLRCRAMPFFAYREDTDQTDMLVPRKDWQCDISKAAPLVYRNKEIVDRTDFDAERAALLAQAPLLRHYADTMLEKNAVLKNEVAKAAMAPVAGRVVVNFMPLLGFHKGCDRVAFAQKQRPVLQDFATRTAHAPALANDHNYYQSEAEALDWFAKRTGN